MDNDTSNARTRLRDILANGTAADITRQWAATQAASEYEPLPRGRYACRVDGGELGTSSKGTPQYTLRFRVIDGPHEGRLLWHILYLTASAIPMAKRDLGKLGVTALAQLEAPLPAGRIRCAVTIGLRRNDDGVEYNRVRRFDVVGVDEPECDPSAPRADTGGDGNAKGADAATPDAAGVVGGDSRFNFDVAARVADAPSGGGAGGNGAVRVAPARGPGAAEGGGR